jgi:hypothetical protein
MLMMESGAVLASPRFAGSEILWLEPLSLEHLKNIEKDFSREVGFKYTAVIDLLVANSRADRFIYNRSNSEILKWDVHTPPPSPRPTSVSFFFPPKTQNRVSN